MKPLHFLKQRTHRDLHLQDTKPRIGCLENITRLIYYPLVKIEGADQRMGEPRSFSYAQIDTSFPQAVFRLHERVGLLKVRVGNIMGNYTHHRLDGRQGFARLNMTLRAKLDLNLERFEYKLSSQTH